MFHQSSKFGMKYALLSLSGAISWSHPSGLQPRNKRFGLCLRARVPKLSYHSPFQYYAYTARGAIDGASIKKAKNIISSVTASLPSLFLQNRLCGVVWRGDRASEIRVS